MCDTQNALNTAAASSSRPLPPPPAPLPPAGARVGWGRAVLRWAARARAEERCTEASPASRRASSPSRRNTCRRERG
eukprot:914563-Rhodomonas_salina.1